LILFAISGKEDFMTTLKISSIILLAFIFVLNVPLKASAGYPEKTMNLVVWGTPGSATDILARTLVLFSEKNFGQPIQITNKPGGNGIVGMSYLLSKPANGYWSLLITNSMISWLLTGTQSFNLESFEFVIRIVTDPLFLFVRKDSPFKTLEDFIQEAKKRPKAIKIGGAGRMGVYELTAFEVMREAGIKLNYIPYDANREAVVATLGGHVDCGISALAPMVGLLKSKDLRLLASTATEPETDQDVPTFLEKKLDVTGNMSRGIAVKKGTPPQMIEKLHATFKSAISSPEWKEYYIDKFQQRQGYLGPADFTKAMKDEERVTREFLKTVAKSK
jgi:tripartite-type tricarboxylate transporter receptor subunit TctC